MKHLLIAILTVATTTVLAAPYDGYKVYRIIPESDHQLNLLKALHTMNIYDFWTSRAKINSSVDVMVSKAEAEQFLASCQKYGLQQQVFIEDVQRLVDTENKTPTGSKLVNSEMKWDQYYSLAEIYAWMDQLAAKYSSIVSVSVAGETYERRPIRVLKLSFKEGNRAVYIEGGIHAREWISPATTNYIITQLLTSSDPNVRKIAQSYDWYIVPVANPDGYVYTHERVRLWRKNRSPNSECYGTDGNRNWDVFWGTSGTSTYECDETYGGKGPASEAETRHLSKVIDSIGSKLDVFLSFHSYGQMMLMPYGHTTEHLDNYDEVLAVGKLAAAALKTKYGTEYAVGNTAETIYSHSGGTMDWVKFNHKPSIAFTYEVRGNPGGFILPTEYILENCEEVMLSFITIFIEGNKSGLIRLS